MKIRLIGGGVAPQLVESDDAALMNRRVRAVQVPLFVGTKLTFVNVLASDPELSLVVCCNGRSKNGSAVRMTVKGMRRRIRRFVYHGKVPQAALSRLAAKINAIHAAAPAN